MNLNINTDMLFEILGAAVGVAGLLTLFMALRRARHWRTRCIAVEASLTTVRRELEIVASAGVAAEARVKRMEEEFTGVVDRLEQVELRGAAQNFDQAIDSARRGDDPGKLAQNFGLSRGEAELVARLHGRTKAA